MIKYTIKHDKVHYNNNINEIFIYYDPFTSQGKITVSSKVSFILD